MHQTKAFRITKPGTFLKRKIFLNFILILFFLFQKFKKLTETSNCNEKKNFNIHYRLELWDHLFFDDRLMWMPSKLSLKLIWNEVVSLHFEEVIAKKVQILMFSWISNNFRNNQRFLMFLGTFWRKDSTKSQLIAIINL